MYATSSIATRPLTFRPLPAALLQEPAASAASLRPAVQRPEPAHGSVSDRARIAQRLLAFGSW